MAFIYLFKLKIFDFGDNNLKSRKKLFSWWINQLFEHKCTAQRYLLVGTVLERLTVYIFIYVFKVRYCNECLFENLKLT
jgi:hypothetical protein